MFASGLLDVVKTYVGGIDAARAVVRLQAIKQNNIWDGFISATEDCSTGLENCGFVMLSLHYILAIRSLCRFCRCFSQKHRVNLLS